MRRVSKPIELTFRRRLDGLVYRFLPATERCERPSWKRADGALDLAWTPEHGWAVLDPAGTVLSLPWAFPKGRQVDHPPRIAWVSSKGDKAYVYDLVAASPD